MHIPVLGGTAQAARLSQVEAVARGLVGEHTHEDPADVRVVVDLRVTDGVRAVLEAARSARADADRVSVEAVTMRSAVARRLAAEGFAVRDIATLLGVSYGRAQQLVGEAAPGPAVRRAGPPGRRPAVAGGDPAADLQVLDGTPGSDLDLVAAGEAKPHSAYQHEAFLFRGDEEFLAGTVPFVREGVHRGQPVLVALTGRRLELFRTTLADEGHAVDYVDIAELGANPARLIPALRGFVDERGGPGRPVRAVGEPVWPGMRDEELAECQLHESLLNLAIAPDTPLWSLCPYDVDALATPVVEEASRSHPALVRGGDYRGSTTYGGAHHAAWLFGRPLPAPAPPAAAVPFGAADLADVRVAVTAHARAAGLTASRTADLALAMTEVATNSVHHGGGSGHLRMWRREDAVVCDVTDGGRIADPLVGRTAPSLTAVGGRGVWLANQLCDLVQIRSGDHGTEVRVLSWLYN